jgi:nucleoside recognition membrane protein YjiH
VLLEPGKFLERKNLISHVGMGKMQVCFWLCVFDFSVLNGSFGQLPGANGATTSFRGAGGAGAKDGFLFALELAPSVILSLGIISITDGLGGLRAAQQLMTPVLKPLLGIPGICSLALIANLQNTDAAAGMTKELAQEGEITERDKVIFAAYQTSGSAIITNYFSSRVAPEFSAFLTRHISDTVKSWDARDMSRQIELNIGKDLQFIRVNGTLVGG